MGEAMSGLDLGQMIGHGFAKLTGVQRDAGATSPVAATASGGIVLPDGTQAMTLDASGNLKIAGKYYARRSSGALDLPVLCYSDGVDGSALTGSVGDNVAVGNAGASDLLFVVSNSSVGRFDTYGNLLVGPTSAYGVGLTLKPSGEFTSTVSVTGGTHNLFINSNGIVGSITTSGAATFYNTSSDARLKENIAAADNGSALIDQLQVRKFDWKSDGSHQRYGFVAQELDAVFPEAVSKPADPEQMMGVDYSKLVPLLVQEVQSLRARLAALEAA